MFTQLSHAHLRTAASQASLTAKPSTGRRSCSTQTRHLAAMAKRLDAHLHIWASREDAEAGKFPFAVCTSSCEHCIT